MILDAINPYWTFIWPRVSTIEELRERLVGRYETEEEHLLHHGKLIVTGSDRYIGELSGYIDQAVEDGRIESAKFTKKPVEGGPSHHNGHYVMCIYADDREEKASVAAVLSSLAIKDAEWKYDRQTIEERERRRAA